MKAEFFRAVFRYRFLVAVILSGVVGIFDILTLDYYFKYDMTQLYMFKCNGWGVMFMFSLVAGAIPGVMGVCEDEESHILYVVSMRFGSYYYAVCKTSMCAITAFLVSILGDLLFSFFTYFESSSFISEQCIQYYGAASPLFLANGYFRSYYGLLMAMQGIRVAFYALLSLGISVFLKNKIAILSLPVVLYYLIINFTYYVVDFPEILDPYVVFRNFQLFPRNEVKSLFYAIGYTIIIGIFITQIVYWRIKKRMGYDKRKR